jgi:hypothetical protein
VVTWLRASIDTGFGQTLEAEWRSAWNGG